MFPGHTTAQWATAVAVFAIGGPFGALVAGTVSNKQGRRGAIIVNTWIFLIGGLMLTFAPSIVWLIPARFLTGFASGCVTYVCFLYLVSCLFIFVRLTPPPPLSLYDHGYDMQDHEHTPPPSTPPNPTPRHFSKGMRENARNEYAPLVFPSSFCLKSPPPPRDESMDIKRMTQAVSPPRYCTRVAIEIR